MIVPESSANAESGNPVMPNSPRSWTDCTVATASAAVSPTSTTGVLAFEQGNRIPSLRFYIAFLPLPFPSREVLPAGRRSKGSDAPQPHPHTCPQMVRPWTARVALPFSNRTTTYFDTTDKDRDQENVYAS